MEIISKDLKADEAISMFDALTTIDEVNEFVAGDERKTVITAAEERRKALVIQGAASSAPTKQGEVKGPITQAADDFKGGVQRTKAADVGAALAPPKSYVTCEDVIELMRKAGRKI